MPCPAQERRSKQDQSSPAAQAMPRAPTGVQISAASMQRHAHEQPGSAKLTTSEFTWRPLLMPGCPGGGGRAPTQFLPPGKKPPRRGTMGK
jgi:hypothetical protein